MQFAERVQRWVFGAPPVVIDDDVWPAAFCEALADEIIASPLLATNTLTGSFQATQGFAVSFCRDAAAEARLVAPVLSTFIDAALTVPSTETAVANAFFVNALVMPAHISVARHVDATLSPSNEPKTLIPRDVIVHYLRVPPGAGALIIDDGVRRQWRVTPKVGMRVCFDGRLAHRIDAGVDGANAASPSASHVEARRISVVAERYVLDEVQLRARPRVHLHTRATMKTSSAPGEPHGGQHAATFSDVLQTLRRERGA